MGDIETHVPCVGRVKGRSEKHQKVAKESPGVAPAGCVTIGKPERNYCAHVEFWIHAISFLKWCSELFFLGLYFEGFLNSLLKIM